MQEVPAPVYSGMFLKLLPEYDKMYLDKGRREIRGSMAFLKISCWSNSNFKTPYERHGGFAMELEQILRNLNTSQKRQEKKLRAKVLEGYKNGSKNRMEIARLLTQLQDELMGKKLFKKYLPALGIPRSTAYNMIAAYKELPNLPDPIHLAAGKRGIDLTLARYRASVQQVPVPENPEENANEWLNDVLARYRELKAQRSEARNVTPLTDEKRNALTMEVLGKQFKKVTLAVGKLWVGVSPDERSLDVFRSLVAEVAAKLGFAEEFTVNPTPETGESHSLVKPLQARTARKRRTGRKEREVSVYEDIFASFGADSGDLAPEAAGPVA